MTVLTPLDKIVFDSIFVKLTVLSVEMRRSVIRVVNQPSPEFEDTITKFNQNLFSTINNGLIGEEISDLFTDYETAGKTFDDVLLLGFSLFDFGDTDTNALFNTVQTTNNDAINLSVQTYVLSIAYNASVNIEYANKDELNNTIQRLE